MVACDSVVASSVGPHMEADAMHGPSPLVARAAATVRLCARKAAIHVTMPARRIPYGPESRTRTLAFVHRKCARLSMCACLAFCMHRRPSPDLLLLHPCVMRRNLRLGPVRVRPCAASYVLVLVVLGTRLYGPAPAVQTAATTA